MTDKYASEYPLPGGVDQYFNSLITLLKRVSNAPPEQQELVAFVFQEYPRTRGSTAVGQYLAHTTRSGLWAIKDGKYRLTPDGSSIVEKVESDCEAAGRMLMEMKFRKIAGYEEMFRFLSEGNRTFDEIDSALKTALRAGWKSKNQTFFRLNWLRSLGYAEKEGHSYGLTPAGRAVLDSLPALQKKDDEGEVQPPPEEKLHPLVKKAIELVDSVDKASVSGKDGTALEQETCNAFAFLGFDAEVISGPGNPDVVIYAPMGAASYRVLIDTKSRSGGVVQQNDVNFNALKQHKAKVNADYMMVLGADFSGGNLETWAQENRVRLLRAEELRQLLLAHAEGALDRLEQLFREGGVTDEAVFSEILAESENTVQAMSLTRALYEAVRKDQDKEGVLNAHSIYYILGGEHSIPAIEAAIRMLQSDLIGALATNENGSLYTRLSPRMLNDKLTQLKERIGGGGGN
jgi:hypothetical protein